MSLALGSVALLGLWLLVACGPRPTPLPAPEPPFAPQASAPSPRAAAPLRVIGRFTGDDERQMRALLARFSAERGVAVEYVGAGEVAELLRQQVEAGQTPDVLLLPKANWLNELAGAGAIVQLPAEVAALVEANFSPAWRALASHEGTLYGVPFDATAKSLLWYRPEALAAVGAAPPATLDELAALAGALAEQNQPALAVPGGAGWPLTDWFEVVLLAEGGAPLYDDLLAHRIAWTDPRVVAAAERFVGLLRAPWLMGGSEGAATLPLDPQTFGRAFDPAAPGAALWLGQGSIVAPYAAELGLRPGEELDVLSFPTGGTLVVVGSLAVATNAEPETMALLRFLAQPEAVEPWVRAGGFVSPNLTLPLERYPTPLAQKEARLLAEARLLRTDLSDRLPPHLGFPFLGDQLREMVRRPADLRAILAEIEQVATREQGRPADQP